jgi:hypothetical protein
VRIVRDVSKKLTALAALLVLAALVALAACASADEYAAERRVRLLELHPPGTPRAQIHKEFGGTEPDFSLTRPEAGWRTFESATIGARALASVKRTGEAVARVERWYMPDGFFSLCYVWFYYDDDDRVVDAEWQYHTD